LGDRRAASPGRPIGQAGSRPTMALVASAAISTIPDFAFKALEIMAPTFM
jgi:hypothetical protein